MRSVYCDNIRHFKLGFVQYRPLESMRLQSGSFLSSHSSSSSSLPSWEHLEDKKMKTQKPTKDTQAIKQRKRVKIQPKLHKQPMKDRKQTTKSRPMKNQ